MTEKLTYDPTPADAPELSEDEQNSLEVAEKLGEEEAKQYAGKFENAQELEKAYLELQKKLGSEDDEDVEKAAEAETPKEEPEQSEGASLINNASKEYYDNDGKISEDTMSKFAEMSSQDLVNAFVEFQESQPKQEAATETADLTDAEINTVYNSVGGESAYNKMISWAGDNMGEAKLDAFNSIIQSGNADAVKIAVSGLRAEYEISEGYEGKMLTGKAARTSDVFRSQAEVVQALSDPKYDRDPAYRQDIYDKLERSQVNF
jgi:hypothetical protein